MHKSALLAFALLLTACGGASSEGPPPGAPPAQRLAWYEHKLDSSESEFRGAVARETPTPKSGAASEAGQGAVTAPPPAASPAPEEQAESAPRDYEERKPEKEEESGCGVACKAFASMKRAADGICDIAGKDDARCKRARKRVGDADDLLRKSGCDCGA